MSREEQNFHYIGTLETTKLLFVFTEETLIFRLNFLKLFTNTRNQQYNYWKVKYISPLMSSKKGNIM